MQRHAASCGPIAIANAVKWCGIETSYAKLLEFCTAIDTYDQTSGMWPSEFRLTLKKLDIPVKVKRSFSVKDLDAVLDSGGAVIFTYVRANGGHAVFIDARTHKKYRIWNHLNNGGPWYHRKIIEKAIKKTMKVSGRMYVYTFQPVARLNK